MNTLLKRLSIDKTHCRDFVLFGISSLFVGIGSVINDTTFNNFLDKVYHVSPAVRGFTEFPRELPGFLMVLIFFSVFYFLGDIRLAILSNMIAAVGMTGMGFLSPNYTILIIWVFIMNTGTHIYFPLNSSIAMSMSKDSGKDGSILGIFQGISTAGTIIGCTIVWVGFRYLKLDFNIAFLIAAIAFALAGIIFAFMHRAEYRPMKMKVLLKKRYSLFYWLNVVYGARKQVFLTFAPWVLIRVFKQNVEVFAVLTIVGAILGMFFKPLLGKLIDRLGEKTILASEAVILVFICLGYGYAESLGLGQYAIYLAFACYIIDQLLMAVGMARATYVKKIAECPEDVSPTVAMGVSIDHIFAILIAVFGGVIWEKLGYQVVFLFAAFVAVVNFISVQYMNIKNVKVSSENLGV